MFGMPLTPVLMLLRCGRCDGPLEKPSAQIQAVSRQAERCAQHESAKQSDGLGRKNGLERKDGLARKNVGLGVGDGAHGDSRNDVHSNLQMLILTTSIV